MNALINAVGEQTMSSREIADLCETSHNHVVETIERLFDQGILRESRNIARQVPPEGHGRPVEVYDLTKRDTLVVVSGYNDELRAKISNRWQELEARPDPIARLMWDAAVFNEREARATMSKFFTEFVRPASAAHAAEAGSFAQATTAEELQGHHNEVQAKAAEALILTPAPDWSAVVMKLEMGVGDGCFDGGDDSRRMLNAILDDIRRLAGSTSS